MAMFISEAMRGENLAGSGFFSEMMKASSLLVSNKSLVALPYVAVARITARRHESSAFEMTSSKLAPGASSQMNAFLPAASSCCWSETKTAQLATRLALREIRSCLI